MPYINEIAEADTGPKTEPLAIIGMACRFAGGITSPEKLWEFVSKGRSAWSEIPEHRFHQRNFYHPDKDRMGTTPIRGGYFLEEDVGRFDPSFFNFSSDLAASMDPQIRMLLELTFESLESAGIPLHEVTGSNTSVFAGTFTKDYHDRMIIDPENVPRTFVASNYTAMVANRISHFFDLKGPSTAIDTGCSTSLVGLHLACQSLRSRESDCAVVGGAAINLNPDIFAALSGLGSCGPEGKCYSFDHRFQGYGRGEGASILVLKRLEDALKNRDPIRAIIRETTVNQDGKTATITSPDFEAQRNLIISCYDKAGLRYDETDLVEAHGTGTKAGDPIEAKAIGSVISHGRSEDKPVYLGSIKANIGHTEAVSGLAAIIKAAKSLEHGQIPPSVNFEKPNPEINFQTLRLHVPQELVKWPSAGVRRASVNNFGYGGTNVHVILEDAHYHCSKPNVVSDAHDRSSQKLFVLSARDEATTTRLGANMNKFLQRSPHLNLNDLAFTLGQRRSKFNWRVALLAGSHEELKNALSDTTLKPVQTQSRVPRLGFVFNGQGAQWYAMGRELMATYPVFVDTLETCDLTIRELGAEWSIIEELGRDEGSSRVNEVRFSMPLSCAIQLALVELLDHWGIRPAAVTGHSTGEVAAAFAAGAITLKEAITITYLRGKINAEAVQRKDSSGAMMAVGLGPNEVNAYIKAVKHGLVNIACFNSPGSVTLSGDTDAINELEKRFKSKEIFARKLKVQAAFHSHYMLPLQKEYLEALTKHMNTEARRFDSDVKFSSPVNGGVLDDAGELGPEHWVINMVEPVRFTDSFRNMIITETGGTLQQDVDIVIEIGPHSALAGPIRQCLSEPSLRSLGIAYVTCLERGKDAVNTAQGLAAVLFQKGCTLNMAHINFPSGDTGCHTLPDLPSYPWNHSTSYWNEPRVSREYRFRKHPAHDLLGLRLPGSSDLSPIWRLNLKAENVPWVRDHVVQSEIVYPASGYISMAIEAARQLHEPDTKAIHGYKLRDIDILKALIIPENSQGIEVQLFFEPVQEKSLVKGWRQFRIYSAITSAESWVENARGLIAVEHSETESFLARKSPSALSLLNSNYTRAMSSKTLFDSLHKVGVAHGPLFQNLGDIQIANGKSMTSITVSDTASTMPYGYQEPHVIHPVTLDSVFQAIYPALSPETRKIVGASVPRYIRSLYVSSRIDNRPGSALKAYSHLNHHNSQGFNAASAVIQIGSLTGTPVIEIEDMSFQSLGKTADGLGQPRGDIFIVSDWVKSLSLNNLTQFQDSLKLEIHADEAVVSKDLVRTTYNLVHEALSRLTKHDVENLEWHHERLYEWMRVFDQQAAANQLDPKSERWSKASEGTKHILMDKVEKASVDGELLVRIGKNILPILRKEVAPLELMMEGQLLFRYYQHILRFVRCTSQAAKVVRAISDENPQIQILEIGAGTGGATYPVLDALSAEGVRRFERYDFTDISAGFFEAAKERLIDWGEMVTFSRLDIEKDVVQQGFKPGSYDVIIATQVLHATKNMAVTMKNVRSLLKDGGKLVLVETTRDTPDVHLIFGTLPGWWLSEEPERKVSPNMSLDTWDRILSETGFTGIDLNVWDCENTDHRSMSCILSTARPTQKPEFERSITIVYADDPPPSDWTVSLMEKIVRETGSTPVLADIATYDPAGKSCILLSGLQGTSQRYNEGNFALIKRIVIGSKGILWVTTGSAMDCQLPENAMHLGLLRTARLEDSSRRYISLDLDPARSPWSAESTDAIMRVFRATMPNNVFSMDVEYAERDAVLMIPRMYQDSTKSGELTAFWEEKEPELQPFIQSGRELRMHVDVPGLLDSIIFKDSDEADLPLLGSWVEIEPKAFGLNFKDIMVAMGMLKEEQEIGYECAGVVTRIGGDVTTLQVGDRVCALTVHGHFANRVRVPSTSVARIPESMPFETAASMVLAFTTAYYSLFWAGHGEEGDTVLIHAAAGGVGQACIILSQWRGLKIYATAGSQAKRDFLIDTYAIPPEHIFSSRNSSFAKQILKATNNKGVDIIINSLAGELLDASWNILAPHGRFVEIGKRDIYENKSLEMEPFRRASSFTHVDVVQLADNKGATVQRILGQIVRMVDQEIIRNIAPVKVFPLAEISRAFRTMQTGDHIGKLVLVPNPTDMVKGTRPRDLAVLHPEATYMVVGGLTGIGTSVAKLLVDRRAKNLLLVSRNATSRPNVTAMTNELAAMGCHVVVKDCDVGNMSSLKNLVQECNQLGMPAIKGVVHGGMVLQDSILERMTWAQWQSAINPKLFGTRNIDELFGDSLDFYVILSSGVGVLGNPSQANYSAGGAYQDAIARHRASKGWAAVTIDLGVVQSVGYVAETAGVEDRLLKSGLLTPLSEAEVMGLIEHGIKHPRRSIRTSQVGAGLGVINTDPRFALLRNTAWQAGAGAGSRIMSPGKEASLSEKIAQATTVEAATAAVQHAVINKVSHMFVLEESDINPSLPLSEYGVDSLVAVELRNWLVPNARIEMSVFDLLSSPSLIELAKSVVERSKAVPATIR